MSTNSGPGSSVSIATGYGLDGPGIEYRWGWDFPHLSRPALGPLPPTSCTMGTGSFPGLKNGRGVTLTPHPLLVPWSRKGRAIPLLPLWAVRSVQSLSACTRVTFTFTCVKQSPLHSRIFWGTIFIGAVPSSIKASKHDKTRASIKLHVRVFSNMIRVFKSQFISLIAIAGSSAF